MAVATIPLILIIYVVVREGYSALSWDFFTAEEFPPRREGGGFVHGFFGTFYIMALAIAMAIPLGIFAAIYLVEFGRGKMVIAVRFFTDVMTGVPSIFVGLFVYALLVSGTFDFGYGTIIGAVAIAIMMLPIVVRSSEEMLRLVPDSLRNAAYGMGARRWQTATKVVLPAAAPGLVTGSMLAIARGAGETAPLLLTILGSTSMVTAFSGERQTALPLLIYTNSIQPFAPGIARAWGGALCLLAVTLLFTIVARIIGSRLAIGGSS
jgi:phosphate transport system permease protein